MCTAIQYSSGDHYFGRNLDFEHPFDTSVVITPRKFPFHFRNGRVLENHYAMIGTAMVADRYPLYFDGTNEKGLSIAGLYFPGNAVYYPPSKDKLNIAPFELIPWILGICSNIREAELTLADLNLINENFSEALPLTPLHWIIAHKGSSLVVESTKRGLEVFQNPVGVLTNNPPFEYQLQNLTNYLNITPKEPVNRFSEKLSLQPHSRGMGAIGLPGDVSSPSRFIRGAFTKLNSVSGPGEHESVSQFFHILESVSQVQGCVEVNGSYEKTLYSSCCNTDKGIYYYKTYENSALTAVRLHSEDLNNDALSVFPFREKQQIHFEN